MSAGTLIVGCGQAAVQLAVSLRLVGYPDRITLIGAERYPPYQRPPLSKSFLMGEADTTSLELRAPAFYRQHGIDVVLNERVATLTLAGPASAGGVARTASGRVLPFDRLALATGARPRLLEVPGATLDGVTYLRDIDDALRLREQLVTPSTRIVVIGGGFIGLEAAAVAAGLGLTVTVVEAANRVMSRVVAPVVSDFYHRAHLRRGVALRLGTGVRAIHGTDGRVSGVELDDGTVLPADAVVIGVGVRPRVELAEQIGLACSDGILVDEHARTSSPAIVAIGDCTSMPNPSTGTGRIRLESVPSAIAQARTAAATLAGAAHPAPEAPWFWSDQFNLKLQMAGLADGHDFLVVRGDQATERFAVLYYRQEALIAIHAINSPADYVAGRLALTRKVHVPAELAADPDISLREIVAAARQAPAAQ